MSREIATLISPARDRPVIPLLLDGSSDTAFPVGLSTDPRFHDLRAATWLGVLPLASRDELLRVTGAPVMDPAPRIDQLGSAAHDAAKRAARWPRACRSRAPGGGCSTRRPESDRPTCRHGCRIEKRGVLFEAAECSATVRLLPEASPNYDPTHLELRPNFIGVNREGLSPLPPSAGPEIHCTRKGTGGSNPSPSASLLEVGGLDGALGHRAPSRWLGATWLESLSLRQTTRTNVTHATSAERSPGWRRSCRKRSSR